MTREQSALFLEKLASLARECKIRLILHGSIDKKRYEATIHWDFWDSEFDALVTLIKDAEAVDLRESMRIAAQAGDIK